MDSYDIISIEGTTNYVSTGTRVDYDGNSDSEGIYLSITDTIALEEGKQYSLVVKNGSDVIYRDMIFCTNQTISDFTINNNEYVTNTTDNDIVIID